MTEGERVLTTGLMSNTEHNAIRIVAFKDAYPIIRQRPLGNVGADSEVRVGRLREDEERSQNDNSSEAEVS